MRKSVSRKEKYSIDNGFVSLFFFDKMFLKHAMAIVAQRATVTLGAFIVP